MKALSWLLVCCSVCGAQTLVDQDIAYGRSLRARVLGSDQEIRSGPDYEKLQLIFNALLNTSRVRSGPGLPHNLTYLNTYEVNAFNIGGGNVFVTQGIVRATNADGGMLAFAMAHELAHAMEHHLVKRYLRAVEYNIMIDWYRRRAAYGDRRAGTEMLVYAATHRIIEGKIKRDEENQADRLGLMIAAEAGYHPDYAFHLTRTLQDESPDKSKFATFLMSDHPRWATREAKIGKNYEQALNTFSSRWPVVAQSPGGAPPQITAYVAKGRSASAPNRQAPAESSENPAAALSASQAAPYTGLVAVTITSSPSGAMISSFGMQIGITPLGTKLAPGTYTLTISAAGYVSSKEKIVIQSRPTATLAFQLEPAKP